jgi:uncharacterized protein YndB with AHSA1/START domain
MSEHNYEIRKEVVLEATPEQVWHAIATAEGQEAWSPDPHASTEGMEVESEEPRRLAIRSPEAENGAFTAFEYIVEAIDGSTTRLRFVHSGCLGDDWDADFDYGEMTTHGWDLYLHTLAEYFRYFPGLPATFVAAQGSAESGTPEAWDALTKDLGLDGHVEVGQHLRLTPTGLPVLEGTVDHAQSDGTVIGLRTGDGLYRFHDMSAMGMPLAVGHYLYNGADGARETAAWEGWLHSLFS